MNLRSAVNTVKEQKVVKVFHDFHPEFFAVPKRHVGKDFKRLKQILKSHHNIKSVRICEKSMARTTEDIRKMYDTHLETGKILQIGHQRLFNPIYIDGIRRIHNGDIGPVQQMRAFWHRNNNWRRPLPGNNSELEKQINWRLYKELSVGLLTELMAHQLHVAIWLMQQNPLSVIGTGSIIYWNDGRTIPDNVELIFSFPGGVKLVYDSMTSNKKYGLEEQVLGNKGTIEFEVNRYFSEAPPPAPGILQLINDIEHGIFAIRSPHRPNHIGFSIVKLEKIENNIITFSEVDILDNTPLLDIKPYVSHFDSRNQVKNGWIDRHFKKGKVPKQVKLNS